MKNRQLELLIYLLKKKKSTQGELAQIFEVSKKTIERDIDRLSYVGVPVFCQQGGGGGVYINENYKFGTSFFAPAEIAYIVAALHIAKSFTKNTSSEEILKKLSLAEPNITTMFEEDINMHFTVDIYEHPTDFESGIFLKINNCMDLNLFAEIDDKINVCIGYVYKPDGLYLFAFQNDYIMIKIQDIKSFTETENHHKDEFLTYNQYKAQACINT